MTHNQTILNEYFKEELDGKYKYDAVKKISNYIKSIVKDTYKPNDFQTLIDKMKLSYNQKSLNQLEHFIKNISQKENVRTNEPIINFEENINAFMNIRKSLEFQLDTKKENPYIPHLRSELLTGEFLQKVDRTYSNKIYAKTKYLEYKNYSKNSYFITMTLPSRFHKYKMKGGIKKDERHYEDFSILVPNEKFGFDNFTDSIIEGLKTLNEMHRHFYNSLKRDISRLGKTEEERLDFIKIIEPHKNLQGHFHEILWIDEEYEDLVYKAMANTVEHFNLEYDFQDIEHIDEEVGTATNYVSKYILKGLEETDEENFYQYYKRFFGKKTKFFSCSNYHEKGLNQRKMDLMYKYISDNYVEKYDAMKLTEKPIYIHLALMYKHKHFLFGEDKIEVNSLNKETVKEDFVPIYEKACEEVEKEFQDLGFKGLDDVIAFNKDNEERQYELINMPLKRANDEFFILMNNNPSRYIKSVSKKEITLCLYKKDYLSKINDYTYMEEPVYFKDQYTDKQISYEELMEFHPTANVDYGDYLGRKNLNLY